jgi:hypothetical protein
MHPFSSMPLALRENGKGMWASGSWTWVPVATYTGWELRADGLDGCDAVGQKIVFARTKAEHSPRRPAPVARRALCGSRRLCERGRPRRPCTQGLALPPRTKTWPRRFRRRACPGRPEPSVRIVLARISRRARSSRGPAVPRCVPFGSALVVSCWADHGRSAEGSDRPTIERPCVAGG